MRILIAIDSSPAAADIIEEIASRTWAEDSEFRVITVVEPTGSWDADKQFIHQAKMILDERVERLSSKLTDYKHLKAELVEGHSAEMILEEAKTWDADLIMLGSHGDTGARRDHLGSVAAAVVNQSPCSVEVVKLHRKSLQLK